MGSRPLPVLHALRALGELVFNGDNYQRIGVAQEKVVLVIGAPKSEQEAVSWCIRGLLVEYVISVSYLQVTRRKLRSLITSQVKSDPRQFLSP